MKPFLRSQLERYAQRLDELDFLLSREDIMSDMAQYRAHLARARRGHRRWPAATPATSSARPTWPARARCWPTPTWPRWRRRKSTSAEAELLQLEDELQRLLLPKDPDDARNAFVEIRAGTGGDESALFAGDLARMYTRYAANEGWKVEVMSANESELGGYKEIVLRIEGRQRLRRAASSNRAATACSACPPPKRRAASTPAPAPWP